jgi:hypothetical protein
MKTERGFHAYKLYLVNSQKLSEMKTGVTERETTRKENSKREMFKAEGFRLTGFWATLYKFGFKKP